MRQHSKWLLLSATSACIAGLFVFFLQKRQLAFDVAAGYTVLRKTITSGKDNEFKYTVPGVPTFERGYFDSPTPTNVLWVLYKQPVTDFEMVQWTFTNNQGQSIIGRPSRAIWGRGHMSGRERIVAFPAPIPSPETISNQIICFESQQTKRALFKLTIP
jgi:hypothetical protein